ncbi:ferritin-like protein [Algoriphagus sp.]|uniref:ferritin-like domain-containing protein n=1 Tax=Algoriphagus sp. TaxID=1872435 RepID=UPI0025DB1D64|nr:ferritin-like protein [Algoriphagus sp.]
MIFLKTIKIETIEDLRSAIQTAIELEHSTIPPYLTANFTLTNTGNDEISNLIGSVVGEEMLHLSIACNLMNAVGGQPSLNDPKFIPKYPGHLPGGVDSGLIVPLEKFSLPLIKNVFMSIEEPENPIDIKAMATIEDSMTIGQFYNEIKKAICSLESEAQKARKTIFTGDPSKQLTFAKFFPEKLLFPIIDKTTAINGINLIVDQGEGTDKDPFVNPDETISEEPAHYYRFEEIYMGKKLLRDPTAPSGFSYSGDAIVFFEKEVPNMKPNPKMADFPVDSLAFQYSKLFNYTYTCLLKSLHLTFNGQTDQINEAMGLMFSLRLYAGKLLATPYPNEPGYMAGPSFEFVTDEDLSETEKSLLNKIPS